MRTRSLCSSDSPSSVSSLRGANSRTRRAMSGSWSGASSRSTTCRYLPNPQPPPAPSPPPPHRDFRPDRAARGAHPPSPRPLAPPPAAEMVGLQAPLQHHELVFLELLAVPVEQSLVRRAFDDPR